eukprot:9543703-Alexandrium_andersonii.AAC.1
MPDNRLSAQSCAARCCPELRCAALRYAVRRLAARSHAGMCRALPRCASMLRSRISPRCPVP